ncbi:MAG TPA: AMP-binding protein [Steroidobacteraceae bacterium]|nr:AMP-binding protein [Steroidobacteraceae bacterium]
MTDRIWLKNYPPGVPHDIDPGQYGSLVELTTEALAKHASHKAYVLLDHAITYAEVDRMAAAFAAWLQSEGFRKGDRIALMLPNVPQYPIAMLGALRAGLIIVNTNPLYTADELRHQLQDSGAAAVLVLENFAHVVADVLRDTAVRKVVVTGVGDLLPALKGAVINFALRHLKRQVPSWSIPGARRFGELMRQFAGRQPAPVALTHADLAFLQYTGGTTGVAKGAMLSHGNMVANVLQSHAWFSQVPITFGTYYIALPLYHIFSLTANCLLFMRAGGTGIMVPNPRDFPAFVKLLRKYPPMVFLGVNTLFNALMNTPGFERIDFSKLVATVGGGMAVQATVAARWLELTDHPLSQGWGLTETSPVVAVCKLTDREFIGSVGLPVPSTDVTSRDDDGNDLGLNASGEICVRGPQVMQGYWNRPDETAKVMLPDGWIRTGDIGRIDDRGFVFLEDRKKDMISVSGFKVFPNEIEDLAARHPGVFESAAIGEPDEKSGEVVALYVVRKDPNLTAEELIDFMRQHVTSYKVPRHIYFRTELPKSNVGKILRRALREGK